MENKTAKPQLKKFGEQIKSLRAEKNLTQTALAGICGMQKATLSKIEKGHVNVSLVILHRLSEGLNVSIHQIIGEAYF